MGPLESVTVVRQEGTSISQGTKARQRSSHTPGPQLLWMSSLFSLLWKWKAGQSSSFLAQQLAGSSGPHERLREA